jgi:hypothetical protein
LKAFKYDAAKYTSGKGSFVNHYLLLIENLPYEAESMRVRKINICPGKAPAELEDRLLSIG